MKACKYVVVGWLAAGMWMLSGPARADYFVATNGTGDGAGSWANATNSIQGAILAAPAGSIIWISNGVYQADAQAVDWNGTNVIYITNSLTLRAWNGPGTVVIDGGGSNRCLGVRRVASLRVVVDGLIMTNGYSYVRGGGFCLEASGAGTTEVWRCVFSGNTVENVTNSASSGGGGMYVYAVAGFKVPISNCMFRGNRTMISGGGYACVGGGAWLYGTDVYQSEFSGNNSGNAAGGVWSEGTASFYDCRVETNTSGDRGGGMFIQASTFVDRCRICGNTASNSGGGAHVVNLHSGDLRNTLVAENISISSYGGVYGYYGISLYNCTIASNTGAAVGGLNVHSSANPAQVVNCIIYDNSPVNCRFQSAYAAVTNTCTTPLTDLPAQSSGNFEGPPLFAGAGDYHLQPGSPCINVGLPLAWMPGARDLDGVSRVDRYHQKVDVGCYEFLLRGSVIKFR